MCNDFLEREVFPVIDKIDAQEKDLMRTLIAKTGEQGLLGISVPEEYGGFGQSFVTSMLASDILGAGFSYAVAFSAHTGIGTLPILYYGTGMVGEVSITPQAILPPAGFSRRRKLRPRTPPTSRRRSPAPGRSSRARG